jgi:hypothetical protein
VSHDSERTEERMVDKTEKRMFHTTIRVYVRVRVCALVSSALHVRVESRVRREKAKQLDGLHAQVGGWV